MKKRIRIGTYNIFHAGLVKDDVGAIGRALSDMELDIAGLQEVDVCTDRMNGMDTLKMIAEAGGYPYYAFAKAIDLAGGAYGTAVLSRYPIKSFKTVALPRVGEAEDRAYGHAVIDLDGTKIDFINTHTSYESVEARAPQLVTLAKACECLKCLIMTGDFNTEDMDELSVFENLTTVNPRKYASYSPGKKAIDHIFLSPGMRACRVAMPTLALSDHYPIWADVELE